MNEVVPIVVADRFVVRCDCSRCCGISLSILTLGALLFVVLSARFPEFQVDSAGGWNTCV